MAKKIPLLREKNKRTQEGEEVCYASVWDVLADLQPTKNFRKLNL